MKMTDSIGRTLSIDVVHRTDNLNEPGKKLWTRPLEYNLEHSGITYCAVPHGAIGLRVMSRLGAELLVYQDGKLLIAAKVEKVERKVTAKPRKIITKVKSLIGVE